MNKGLKFAELTCDLARAGIRRRRAQNKRGFEGGWIGGDSWVVFIVDRGQRGLQSEGSEERAGGDGPVG